jgi:hypothetical protein
MRIPPLVLALTLGCTTTGLPGGEAPPGRQAAPPAFTSLQSLATPAPKSPVLVALEQEMARSKVALKELLERTGRFGSGGRGRARDCREDEGNDQAEPSYERTIPEAGFSARFGADEVDRGSSALRESGEGGGERSEPPREPAFT